MTKGCICSGGICLYMQHMQAARTERASVWCCTGIIQLIACVYVLVLHGKDSFVMLECIEYNRSGS